MKGFIFYLSISFTFICFHASGQEIKSQAKADTTTILIGEQFNLSVELSHPSNIAVEWPLLADTFSLLEVVKRSEIDTLANKDGNITRRQQFSVTSFDSGFHVIPPFVFKFKNPGDTAIKTSETLPILVTVNSIQVDTTKAIKDLKAQVAVPLSWRDFLPFIIGALVILLLSYIIYRIVKKQQSKIKLPPPVSAPARPPHEIALEALQQLTDEKIWQQGNFKLYYTRLTDIIRIFIDNKWSMPALEMTTDEIMHLKIIIDQEPSLNVKLKHLLEYSDLVKFAKVTPVSYECEQSMQSAIDFVKGNVPEIIKKPETI